MNDELRTKVYPVQHAGSDRLSGISWALILIWAGTVFLADNVGLLERLMLPRNGLDIGFLHPSAWSMIFLGAGLIVLLEAFLRSILPNYAAPSGGSLIFAAILIGVGLSNLFRSDLIWPLVIIGIGVAILLGSVLKRSAV